MQTFVDSGLLNRLRVGPLAPYLDAFLKCIEQVGLLPSSVPVQMYAIARFSNWLATGQVDLHQVDGATVERFLSVIWMLFMVAKQLLCSAAWRCCARSE
jgi:hypothetical protein